MKEASGVLRARSFMAAYHKNLAWPTASGQTRGADSRRENARRINGNPVISTNIVLSQREWVAVAHGNHGKTAF